MKKRKYRYFACDFETTVYEGQKDTEVWASACVELFDEKEQVVILHSIEEQFKYFLSLDCNVCAYYHNLKFDGSFWLSYLLTELNFKQAYTKIGNENEVEWLDEKDMPNKSFRYSISDKGQWYTITIRVNNHYIEIRDSLKLLPFSIKKIGNSFKTKHKKLEMEYKGFRYAGCEITDDEKKYIANDVLVLKEALEIMFNEGHKKLTIGSCCLAEYKSLWTKEAYAELFPDLYQFPIDGNLYGENNAGEYIRHSYKGGWCYVVKGKENQIKHNGITADVNSLYPSMMHSESGNRYPVGLPTFWKGNYIPDEARENNRYYFVRIRTRFYIKPDKLPFIQIKHSFMYDGTEMLETSDVYSEKTGKYYDKVIDDFTGEEVSTDVELTLTMTDYKLIKEHYQLVDCEILDGCYFSSMIGLFDEYINKYKKIKQESKGAIRELAKLFLNNLYGKFASSTDSSFKVAYVKPDGALGFFPVYAQDKEAGYIPIGSAITSYARNFTIRAAQMNYYGVDKAGFIYADTDSIHCDLPAEQIKGIKVDAKEFCCWKLESYWDTAIFVRQKTYIEHITHEDGEPIEDTYYNIKCAGMPEKCKNLFNLSMTTQQPEEGKEYKEEELEFIHTKRTLTDFKIGLKITGNLMPKRIKGGVLLVDTTYEMR